MKRLERIVKQSQVLNHWTADETEREFGAFCETTELWFEGTVYWMQVGLLQAYADKQGATRSTNKHHTTTQVWEESNKTYTLRTKPKRGTTHQWVTLMVRIEIEGEEMRWLDFMESN